MKKDVSIHIKMDPHTLAFFKTVLPYRLDRAKKNAVDAMGKVWADESKEITHEGNHIDTGLYVNSIGYATGAPATPIHEIQNERNRTTLKVGANVEYAIHLERKFHIMARGLDRGRLRMKRVAVEQIRRVLGL